MGMGLAVLVTRSAHAPSHWHHGMDMQAYDHGNLMLRLEPWLNNCMHSSH